MRRPDPFGKGAMALSMALHAGLFGLGWLSTLHHPPVLEFITYQVELVSPPPARQAEEATPPAEELVVERPQPEPPAPEEEKPKEVVPVEKPVEKKPEPPPERKEPPAEKPPDPAEEKKPAAAPEPPPAEKPKESGEGINVRLEGVRRDYPEYYNNIIRQIQRCFRWTGGGSWETTVYFVIKRDGSTDDVEFVQRSGNASFDFQAMGAIADCAGQQGRFGPLPKELPYDRLPVQFNFKPNAGGDAFLDRTELRWGSSR